MHVDKAVEGVPQDVTGHRERRSWRTVVVAAAMVLFVFVVAVVATTGSSPDTAFDTTSSP